MKVLEELLARSMSPAWIELPSKQAEDTQANRAEGSEVSSLMKGCEVSSIIMVQLQVFSFHCWQSDSPSPQKVHMLSTQGGSPPVLSLFAQYEGPLNI